MERRFGLGGGGTLTVREEGDRAALEAERPDDGRGLYKAYLRGKGGRFLLGTLMPEHGRLGLRRTLPLAELARHGVWPVQSAEAELAFPFGKKQPSARTAPGWRGEGEPARLLGDRVLSRAAQGLRGVLFRQEGTGFALAAPFRKNEAFPLPPLFCFASIETVGQREYAVFHFNGHGCPIFQNKENEAGDNKGAIHEKE